MMKFKITKYSSLGRSLIGLVPILLLSACQHASTISSNFDRPEAWQLHLRPATLEDGTPLAIHETIYLPVYAHIYYSDHTRLLNLAETVSIRNTDLQEPIILTSVRHYRTDGSLLKEYIDKPLLLKSLATADFVVPENDITGGTGANFIIEWVSKTKVCEPITESIMVFTGSSHSISFLSRGVVLQREERLQYNSASKFSRTEDRRKPQEKHHMP